MNHNSCIKESIHFFILENDSKIIGIVSSSVSHHITILPRTYFAVAKPRRGEREEKAEQARMQR